MVSILFSWVLWIVVTFVSGILVAIGYRSRYSCYLELPSSIVVGAYTIYAFIWSANCLPVILTMDKGGGALLIGFMVLSVGSLYLAYVVGKRILLRYYRWKLGWK